MLWDLITICCHALNCVKPESWIYSFKKVNLHPDFRKCFAGWKKQTEVVLKANNRFYNKCIGLFDAMPACWKGESVDFWRKICSMIDYFHVEAKDNDVPTNPWIRDNLLQLSLYIKLPDIPKWRGCWLVTKEDKTVFEEEVMSWIWLKAIHHQKENKTMMMISWLH
jgi:hypothetical protein